MKSISTQILSLACAAAAFTGVARADIIEVTADISADTRWSRDNVYVLPGTVYVLPPARLTIEPGTLIRAANDGLTGGSNNPGTLAICRGAKVIGNGTVDDPIIFTSVDDTLVQGGANTRPTKVGATTYTPLNYGTDGPTGNNAFSIARQCGGLVLLGRTPLAYDGNGATARYGYDDAANTFTGEAPALPTGGSSVEAVAGTQNEAGDGSGFAVIEGLSVSPITLGFPFDPDGSGSLNGSTSFQRGVYGGVDEDDDSGVVRFWSIRYGGFPVAPGIELNGLTLGAVGRGTTVEWVEVCQNADDDFEWFGGYVNSRYLLGMYGGDDGIDVDQGFSGSIQHAFLHMGGGELFPRAGYANAVADATTAGKNTSQNVSERAFEWDGPEPNNSGILPRTKPWVFNATIIGNKGGVNSGSSRDGIRSRRACSGQIQYALFEDITSGVIEQSDNSTSSPLAQNDTDLLDSYYFNTGAANVSATADAGTDRFTVTGTSPANGTPVEFSGSTTAPTGIVAAQQYYVVGSTASAGGNFQVSATIGGAAVDFSDAGTGVAYSTLGGGGNLGSTTIALTGTERLFASQITAKGQLVKNGLNPTLIDEAAAGTSIKARKLTRTAPSRPGTTGFFSPVKHTGAMRDNNWLFGWSWTATVDLLPTTNMARPVLTLDVSAANPTVSFNADTTVTDATDAVEYVVERSTDGREWVPFVAVQDGDSSDTNAAAGLITVTDSAFTYTGTPVHYRVIAQ